MGALVQFSSWRRDMELQWFVVCQFHDCQILLDWMEVIRKLMMVENEESSHLEPVAKTNAKPNLLVSSSDMLKANCVSLTSCNHNYQLGLCTAMHYQWDEWQKWNKGLHLKTLLFSDIYRIQIVQNITQLSSKGRFNQPLLFLIHWNFGSN